MEKISINRINEDIYYEKLDNGLEVYMYVNQNVHNNYVTFTTRYGSIYNEFYIGDKLIKTPNGVAHFLEHKVFALESDPQPEEFYARSGGICNAYTTFKNTTYLFSSPNNLIDNTLFLLDFVQNIYLTKENVKSEKGIINQEINMCDDAPSEILYDKIRYNTIKNNPFKESIIGTHDEVNSISKEILMDCYNNFYSPKNMFLVVCGNFDKDEVMSAIKDNQSKKNFDNNKEIKLKKYNESNDIVKEYEIVKCNTNIPKIAYNIKIPVDIVEMDPRKLSIYMFLIFNIIFGETSDFDYDMKNKGIITSSIYYNLLDIDSHFIISLVNNTDKYKELIDNIDKYLDNIYINKNEFDRKKKVLISNEIFNFENVEMVNDMIIDNIIYDNKICNNIMDIIDSLNLDELNSIIKKIDFKNKSIVVLER